MQHIKLACTLQCWQANAVLCRGQQRVLEQCVGRLQHRQLAAAFQGWLEASQLQAEQRDMILMALRHWQLSAQAAALNAWKVAASACKHKHLLKATALSHWRKQQLLAGLSALRLVSSRFGSQRMVDAQSFLPNVHSMPQVASRKKAPPESCCCSLAPGHSGTCLPPLARVQCAMVGSTACAARSGRKARAAAAQLSICQVHPLHNCSTTAFMARAKYITDNQNCILEIMR